MKTLNFIKSAVLLYDWEEGTWRETSDNKKLERKGKKSRDNSEGSWWKQTDKVVGWREECKAGVWLWCSFEERLASQAVNAFDTWEGYHPLHLANSLGKLCKQKTRWDPAVLLRGSVETTGTPAAFLGLQLPSLSSPKSKQNFAELAGESEMLVLM